MADDAVLLAAVAERAAAILWMAPPAASPAAHTSLQAHGRGRSQRGLIRRVAILAIGMIVSIVAARTASARRSLMS